MSFGVSCHLAFHVILRFMSFGVSCHLVFHVIWRFMSLAFHVILVIIVIFMANNAKVVIEDRCVFKKWPYSHRAVLLQELLRS